MRLQPLGLQPYLVKAPTLDLGASTPRTPIVPILRHQPQELQPYLVKVGAPTPRTPILPILRHQPHGLRPSAIYCLDMFGSNSLLPRSSSLNFFYLQLHCYINDNLSSYEGVFTTLHIAQTESTKLPHDDFK